MAGRSQLPVQIMENQTRFDLNAAVENWRNELAAQPNLASDDRRELETHLRDTIAGFQHRGLNDEESFWLARLRVGQTQQIGEEFAKTNPTAIWRERLFWMLNALLFLNLWGRFTATILMRHTDFNIPITNFLNGLAYIVPVFCCVIFISNNRLQNGVKSLGYIFQSRTRFLLFGLLFILAVDFETAPFVSRFTMPQMFFVRLLYDLPANFSLIALIAWLLPPQNRKTPKRA